MEANGDAVAAPPCRKPKRTKWHRPRHVAPRRVAHASATEPEDSRRLLWLLCGHHDVAHWLDLHIRSLYDAWRRLHAGRARRRRRRHAIRRVRPEARTARASRHRCKSETVTKLWIPTAVTSTAGDEAGRERRSDATRSSTEGVAGPHIVRQQRAFASESVSVHAWRRASLSHANSEWYTYCA